MKQKLCAALLCGALALGLAAPAQAIVILPDAGGRWANQEMYEFWQLHQNELEKKYEVFNKDQQPFSDGLILSEAGGNAVYINKQGEVIDLNQGRFDQMYPFSSGLAAVVKDDRYGYIDTNGTLVIPIQFDLFNGDITENHRSAATGFDYTKWEWGTPAPMQVGKFIGDRAMIPGAWCDIFRTPTDGEAWQYPGRHLTGKMINYDQWWKYFVNPTFRGVDYVFIDRSGNFCSPINRFETELEAIRGLAGYTYGMDGIGMEGWLTPQPEPVFANPIVPYVIYNGPADGKPITPNIEEPPAPTPQATYGQSTYKSLGYTIVGNIGYLNIEVTNSGIAPDTGDLFYVLYNKYNAPYRDNTTDFLPADYIRQIHYDLAPGETKILRAGVGQTGALGRELTEAEKDYGWFNSDHIADSRYVLAQAETMSERDELIAFFKTFHYWEGFMELDFQPDANGVTILAAPGGNIQERDGLDKKLAAFTAQF